MRTADEDEVRAVCSELLPLLATSFGPCAGKKLCVGPGGNATITSEGLEVLGLALERKRESENRGGATAKQLHLTKVIHETCANHVRNVGDGK